MATTYKNWTKKFFSGIWLELQTKIHSEAQTLEQTKFIIGILKLKKKSSILDCPCGDGRISNIFAKKGHKVTGIDNNDYLLNLARINSAKLKLSIKYVKNEMYNIDFKDEFDAAICFGGSFGYFDDNLNLKFLERIFQSLKHGGKFLLDTHTVESILLKFQKAGWFKVDNIYVTEYRTYDIINSRINSDWTLIKKGKVENKSVSIRLYSYTELINILKGIGFKNFRAYGSIKADKFIMNQNRLYLVAQK